MKNAEPNIEPMVIDVHGAAQRVADPLSAFAEPKGGVPR